MIERSDFVGIFAKLFSFLGFGAANLGSQACMAIVFDEPKMPKSMIK